MKQTSFQQLFALFDAKIQISQQLIVYNGYDIAPFANITISGMHAFLLIIKGNITLSINHKEYTFKQNTFIDITNDKTFRFIDASADLSFYCLFANNEFLRDTIQNIRLLPRTYFYRVSFKPALQLTPTDANALRLNLSILQSHIARKSHIFFKEIANNLFLNLMYEIGNIFNKQVILHDNNYYLRKQDIITFRFIDLVRKNCKEQHEIDFYASQLNLSPKHLGRVVKSTTGKTLYKIISEELTIEAISLISKEDTQIQQIADELHFADIASFSKFFKRNTGMSPMQYRER